MAYKVIPLCFPTGDLTTINPTTAAVIKTNAVEYMTVKDATFQLTTTLDAALNVVAEVTLDDPKQVVQPVWVAQGKTVNVGANAGPVQIALADLFNGVIRRGMFIRLSITPAQAPTQGALTGQCYREW